jgi:hypothetical protein
VTGYPDVTALLVALVTSHWPVDPELTFLVSRLLRSETAMNAAVFLKTLGSVWKNVALEQELIWKVSQRLKWDECYYHAFVNAYLSLMVKLNDSNSADSYQMLLFLLETWRDSRLKDLGEFNRRQSNPAAPPHHLPPLRPNSAGGPAHNERLSASSFGQCPSFPTYFGLPPASSLDFMKNMSLWDMDGLLMTTPPSPPAQRRSLCRGQAALTESPTRVPPSLRRATE